MIRVRRARDRGHASHGWLDSWHTFSFADYYDPEHMGFRALRVINQDRVDPGAGFPTHPHRSMEIISYVLEGALEHRDSMGTGSVIRPGDVQLMSAGTGVTHSEFNGSREEPVRFLQIWIVPEQAGGQPRYEQQSFPLESRRGKLRLLVSPDGTDGSLRIGQDARVFGAVLAEGEVVTHQLAAGRHAWVQVARGSALLGDTRLEEGDGAQLSDISELTLRGSSEAEILVFDLA